MAADVQTRILGHQMLDGLGLRAADLQACLTLPTIAEFLPRVIAMDSSGMRRTYGSVPKPSTNFDHQISALSVNRSSPPHAGAVTAEMADTRARPRSEPCAPSTVSLSLTV